MALVNRTRRSASIPRRLRGERKYHLLPLYALLRLSDLAREAMENSGSFRFADHIYVDRASGITPIGRLLDRLLLRLPAARSFRNRFLHVKASLRRFLIEREGALTVLSVPSGIPRDLIETAAELRASGTRRLDDVSFVALDLDPEAHRETARLLDTTGIRLTLADGDALEASSFPRADFITSTGFTEFLPDEAVVRFFANCRTALAEGGRFVTSATVRHAPSTWLMEEIAELHAHYRDEPRMAALLTAAGFSDIHLTRDAAGYQVLVTATK
jgi:SAM-dependent methyltransferase